MPLVLFLILWVFLCFSALRVQSPCLGLLHPSSRQCKGKIFTPATTTVAIVCGDGDIVSVIRAAAIVCSGGKKGSRHSESAEERFNRIRSHNSWAFPAYKSTRQMLLCYLKCAVCAVTIHWTSIFEERHFGFSIYRDCLGHGAVAH